MKDETGKEFKYQSHELKHLTVLIPNHVPISIMAEPNVRLRTMLLRYEDFGDIILQNGKKMPLETLVEDKDMLIVVRKKV